MRDQGFLTPEQAEVEAYPLVLTANRTNYGDVAPYFVEWLRQTLDARFGRDLYERGLRVYTTLDLDVQESAERALETQLDAIEAVCTRAAKCPAASATTSISRRPRRRARITAPTRRTSRAPSSRWMPRPATSASWSGARLRRLQVQPRDAGGPPAGFDVQAVRIRRRGSRRAPRHRDRGRFTAQSAGDPARQHAVAAEG